MARGVGRRFTRDRPGFLRLTTGIAELGSRSQFRPAAGTRELKWRRAFLAEFRALAVFVLAGRTFHLVILKEPAVLGSFKNLKTVRDRIVHVKSEDRRSSGPDHPALWHEVFKIEPPHEQAKELIAHFVEATGIRPRWFVEYPR